MEDEIDPGVGFVIHAKPGASVKRGEKLATVHARDETGIRKGIEVLAEAITIGDESPNVPRLVTTRITAQGSVEWRRPT
jgi:thymidine phosphorylase